MNRRLEPRSEYAHVRLTPTEKLELYRLGSRRGGLSGAIRYLIQQYSRNDKVAIPAKESGDFVSATN